MSGLRRAWIDVSPGETRGVVELDGKPEHFLIEREGEAPFARLGAHYAGRVTATAAAGAYVDIGTEPTGWIAAAPAACSIGARVVVEVVAERRGPKGPRLRLLDVAEGSPRLVAAGPTLETRLCALAGSTNENLGRGDEARAAADRAQEAALATVHGFKGGLTLAVEATRALVAIDVDVASPRDATMKEANLRAIRESARLLRVKALGGTIAVDLAGVRHPEGLVRAEANAAFAADGPDVRVWPLAAAGLLLVSKPHRRRPLSERLRDPSGAIRVETRVGELMRDLERVAREAPGARLCIHASASVAAALAPHVARLGPQFSIARRVGGDVLAADIVRS